jgi:hypothetical protein
VAELPGDANAAQKAAFERVEGGALVPAVCVDKALDELSTFAAFAQEAEPVQPGLGHRLCGEPVRAATATPPSAADAEEPLRNAWWPVDQGGRRPVACMPFNRQGEPVQLG